MIGTLDWFGTARCMGYNQPSVHWLHNSCSVAQVKEVFFGEILFLLIKEWEL